MLEGFEHQDPHPPDHEAIALFVERTAGCSRVIVAEGQSFGAGEAGHS